ncbi:phage virion morphogenesis protein [Sinirhodobacter populi]|uniref:Phage virion morphogenesis protein n=1 Tax=Paenirhodobacter populi TaxID=2306993 RepID=A0A443K8Z5_9RHOB|nr:phage virion morphogenesis protein [Sinirhodobacter populi]RWR29196.1 phage virion morphogenesis protein [Sinirhodobacter populi]
MTGVKITVEILDEEAREGLQRVFDRLGAQGGLDLNKQIGKYMVGQTQKHFREERAPDGTPWQHLSPVTMRKRMKSTRTALSILRDSGILSGGVNYRATPDEVSVGATAPYAMIHQFGGTIAIPSREQTLYFKQDRTGQIGRRFAKRKKATHEATVRIPSYQVTIPARPYLGLSPQDEQIIPEIAEDWLSRD